MLRIPILLAVGVSLLGCAGSAPTDTSRSCTDIADRRAARQLDIDSATLDQGYGAHDTALERDFIRIDAEAYRDSVRRNCLRLRAGPSLQKPEQNGG